MAGFGVLFSPTLAASRALRSSTRTQLEVVLRKGEWNVDFIVVSQGRQLLISLWKWKRVISCKS